MVLLIPALSVQRKLHGKDQIAIPRDKHDSSPLQAQLWRNDELYEYQQGSQLSLTQGSILQTHMLKWVKCLDKYKISKYVLTNLKICSHRCLGQK